MNIIKIPSHLYRAIERDRRYTKFSNAKHLPTKIMQITYLDYQTMQEDDLDYDYQSETTRQDYLDYHYMD